MLLCTLLWTADDNKRFMECNLFSKDDVLFEAESNILPYGNKCAKDHVTQAVLS